MIRKMNKNAQIGATINWIAATLIILVIMFIYVGFTFIIPGKGTEEIKKANEKIIDQVSLQSVLSFLKNSEVFDKDDFEDFTKENNIEYDLERHLDKITSNCIFVSSEKYLGICLKAKKNGGAK